MKRKATAAELTKKKETWAKNKKRNEIFDRIRGGSLSANHLTHDQYESLYFDVPIASRPERPQSAIATAENGIVAPMPLSASAEMSREDEPVTESASAGVLPSPATPVVLPTANIAREEGGETTNRAKDLSEKSCADSNDGDDEGPESVPSPSSAAILRWRDYWDGLDEEERAALEEGDVWQRAKELGQLHGRKYGEAVLVGEDGQWIRSQIVNASKIATKKGWNIGEGLNFPSDLDGTVADFLAVEAGSIAMLAKFMASHPDMKPWVIKRLNSAKGFIYGEHSLTKEERKVCGGMWRKINLRIKADSIHLVAPEVRRSDPVNPDEEIEMARIIFNTQLGVITVKTEEDICGERRLQSGDHARKACIHSYFASYVLASYLQTILEDTMVIITEGNLVVGLAKVLWSLPNLLPQIIHRDTNVAISATVDKGKCTIGRDPVSAFIVSNVSIGGMMLSEVPDTYYDYGASAIGAVTRQCDDAIFRDIYRSLGVLDGDNPKPTSVKIVRKNLEDSGEEGKAIVKKAGTHVDRYLNAYQELTIGLEEAMFCFSDVPHHGLAAPNHSEKKREFDLMRGRVGKAKKTRVRYWKEWPRYVNDEIWRLWPRFHINLDRASNTTQDREKNLATKLLCVGDKTSLTTTFVYDPLHPDYTEIRVYDLRVKGYNAVNDLGE